MIKIRVSFPNDEVPPVDVEVDGYDIRHEVTRACLNAVEQRGALFARGADVLACADIAGNPDYRRIRLTRHERVTYEANAISTGCVVSQLNDGSIVSRCSDIDDPLQATVKAVESHALAFDMDRPLTVHTSDGKTHQVKVSRVLRAEVIR